ncbi:probable glutamate receptor isoform X1 [Homarus americanus]|uniref:probable glutamate receptor isoform X1 n=1 Tax=Homarus americanus TaxID=6706 RepID=UPI001C45040A|nr:probable glutamate receptor isoform X1 [Homarus americanus]
METLLFLLLTMLLMVRNCADGTYRGALAEQVGEVVGQVVEQHLSDCHLVLVDTTTQSPVFSTMIRQLMRSGLGVTVLEAWWVFFQSQPARDFLLERLWGDATLTCCALLIHLDNKISSNILTFKFLEWCELWRHPQTVVVAVGGTAGMEAVLLDQNLRNTVYALYLTLQNLTLHSLDSRQGPLHNTRLGRGGTTKGKDAHVRVYGRCLYCNKGDAQVQLLHRGNLTSGLHGFNLFPDQMDNFWGHTFRAVTLRYMPFINYEQDGAEPGTPRTPLDSLNIRMLDIIASHFNFTYEIREPWDRNWGTPAGGGNWTGIVGTLQHEQADFSLDLTVTASRSLVVDYSRVYSNDPIVIITLKPAPLPRNLALTRPFEGEVWMSVIVCTLALGIILWLQQKVWSWAASGRSVRLIPAFLNSWAMLLMEPVETIPTNTTGQVLVGWWLLSCVIITTAYRSSLIAHLSVQSKYPPINTFQDLLNLDGWSWGSTDLQGTFFLYFNESSDPDLQAILRGIEIYEMDKGLERVMQGGFSFIHIQSYVTTEMARLYTDKFGNTPLYIGIMKYLAFGGNAWGFRKGAPFTRQISMMKERLIEAGLLNLWQDDVLKTYLKHSREERGREDPLLFTGENSGQVVLGLDHLQGAFYLLLLGCCLALLVEIFSYFCYKSQKSSLVANHTQN